MKIVSWNINGIRTFRNNLKAVFKELECDVICLQETKVSRSTLEEDLAIIQGYSSYFNSSRYLSGYAGVATYCNESCCPHAAEEGLSGNFLDDRFKQDSVGDCPEFDGIESTELNSLESEGRAILTKHHVRLGEEVKSLVIINVYCPRNDPDRPERANYKLQFYSLLQQRAEALLKNGNHVIIAGDINTSHKPIDCCQPGEIEEFCSTPSRQWMDSFLFQKNEKDSIEGKGMFVDTFRYFNPHQTEAYTCWMTLTGARKTNYGTRIDYIFADTQLGPYLESASILSEVEGSDHCPVTVTIKGEWVASKRLPSICTRYWPEFAGKQQSLTRFLMSKGRANDDVDSKQDVKRRPTRKSPQQKSITNFFKFKDIAIEKEENETKDVFVGSADEKKKTALHETWKTLLKGPPKPPKCTGHQETCLVRIVKKEGLNYGRQFFVCCRAKGHPGNPEACCDYFQWVTGPKLKKL